MNQIMIRLVLASLALVGMTACNRSPEARKQQAMERGKKHLESRDYARAVLEFKNAAQAAPKDAEPYYQLGMAFLASGDVRSAYASFRRATELNPSHSAAQIKVSELQTLSNRPELLKDAAQRLESILASKPGDSDALSALAFTELRMGETKDAEEHLARALESGPSNLRAAVGLAKLRVSQSKAGEAEEILRRTAEQKPPVAMAYIALGEFYVTTNKRAEAKREFDRALEIEKDNVLALRYLGTLHTMAGETAEADAVYRRISALPDKRYKATHAVYLYQTGKRDDAVKELEQLVSADPADRATRRRLVAAYLSMGKAADAERVLASALAKNAKDVDALLQRGAMRLSAGKFLDAQNDVTQVLKFEPNSAEAHYLLARVHAVRGNTNSWKQELAESIKLNPEFLAARLEYARGLMRSNAAKPALNILDQAPEWQRRNPAIIAERNWALAILGNKAEMRSSLDSTLKTVRTPDLMLQDAVLKLDGGNVAGGRSTLEEMLKQYPQDLRALELLAQSYAAQGQTPAAVRRIREYAAENPKSARVQYQLGAWLSRSGASKEAKSAFETAKSLDPNFWYAETALAGLETAENNTDAVRKRLQPLVSHPQAGIQARMILATAEQRASNQPAVIEHCRRILEAQPDNLFALNNLAYELAASPNTQDQALKLAERAKELAPDNATIDDTIGWILYKKGLYARAVQHLESAVKREANATRHAHLALAYAARGDKNRGFEQLQAAIKMNPKIPEVAEAQKALAGVR